MISAVWHQVRQTDREDHGGVLRRTHGQAHHVPAGAPQNDNLPRGPGGEACLAVPTYGHHNIVSNVPVIFRYIYPTVFTHIMSVRKA